MTYDERGLSQEKERKQNQNEIPSEQYRVNYLDIHTSAHT